MSFQVYFTIIPRQRLGIVFFKRRHTGMCLKYIPKLNGPVLAIVAVLVVGVELCVVEIDVVGEVPVVVFVGGGGCVEVVIVDVILKVDVGCV